MKKILLICCATIFLIQISEAQQTFEKTYGTTAAEIANSVRQTSDGGYILGGTNLVKVNSQGIEEWTKPLPSSFANTTDDDGFILIRNGSGIIFTKVDASGNTMWQTVYTEGHWANEGQFIEQTEDGGYIVTGRYQSVTGSGMLLLKLNAQGGKVWKRTFTEATSAGFNFGKSVQQTSDKGYIMAGNAYVNYYDSTRHKDIFIIKTDSVGTEQWRKYFGDTADDLVNAVRIDNSGNYFISATTNSYGIGTEANMYLIKLDASGNLLWEKTYGGNLEETATGLWATNDGGCIMTGRSNSFSASGDFDGYIVKTDANGDTLWTNLYNSNGGTGDEELRSVQQTSDNGFIMAGGTNSVGAGDFDMLLLKTDASGDLSFVTNVQDDLVVTNVSRVFPNPNRGVFSIQSEENISSIEIFDMTGKRVYFSNINKNTTTLDLSHQAKGIYFYQLKIGKEARLQVGKIIFE